MIYPKPRRINVGRMKKYRERFWPQYRRQVVDRDDILDMGEEIHIWMRDEMYNDFRQRMLAHHMYDSHRWLQNVEFIFFTDFDIDFNRQKFVIEERFTK